jgi:hypothetical protein
VACVLGLALGLAWSQTARVAKTDAEIKKAIINQSIASYRGNRAARDGVTNGKGTSLCLSGGSD